MCIFNNKRLVRENDFLHATIARLNREIEDLQESKQNLETELIARKNITERDNRNIDRLLKRIKSQQAIIDKQNEQLGYEPKSKKKKKDVERNTDLHDPYIEE